MSNRPISLSRQRSKGFSLLELMIVVVILGIIVAIGYPSYADYVRKGKRSVAKSALLDIANRQEQFFFSNRAYTSDLTALNFNAATAYFSENGAPLGSSTDAIYKVTAEINATSCGGAPCFKLKAEPLGTQASDSCTEFTLTSANVREPATGCW